MKSQLSLEKIEQAIANADPQTQKRLLRDMPRLLKIPADNMALLIISQPAFGFWDNPEDSIYDEL